MSEKIYFNTSQRFSIKRSLVNISTRLHHTLAPSHAKNTARKLLLTPARTAPKNTKPQNRQCVAIGECGLDFAVETPMKLQERALERQFELARRFELPVILHSRKAHNRLIQMVKAAKLPKGGVLHAFSGSYQQAMEWVR